MKKLFLIMSLVALLVTACGANLGINVSGDLETDLLPGNNGENSSESQQQTGESEILRNPVVIGLLILVVVLIVVLVSRRPNRGM